MDRNIRKGGKTSKSVLLLTKEFFTFNACEIWSFTLREEHRLRMFGNRVLRRIFGNNRTKLCNDDFYSL